MKTLLAITITILSLSTSAFAYGIGGAYCCNLPDGEIRETVERQFESGDFTITVRATVKDVPLASRPNGQIRNEISMRIIIQDHLNTFQPEWGIPVLVRAIKVSYHRDSSWRVESYPLNMNRIYGDRKFFTDLVVTTNSFPGAEHVEELNKLEILIPGIAGVRTISFGRN